MFESYISSQTSYFSTAAKPLSLSTLAHGSAIVAIVLLPYATIKQLPLPAVPIEMFESVAPPPPPPPPKPKEDKVITEDLVEPEEVPEEIPEVVEEEEPPPPPPKVEEKGQEEGQEGGVEGGWASEMPAKLLTRPQRKLSGQAPRFPQAARTQGLTATLAARICISAQGNVKDVRILSGSPIFREAVKKAVLTWRYEPYKAGSKAIPTCFPAYFNFNLRG